MVVRIASHAQITDEILMTGKAPIVSTKKNEKSIPGGPSGTVFLPDGGITSIDRHGKSGVGFVGYDRSPSRGEGECVKSWRLDDLKMVALKRSLPYILDETFLPSRFVLHTHPFPFHLSPFNTINLSLVPSDSNTIGCVFTKCCLCSTGFVQFVRIPLIFCIIRKTTSQFREIESTCNDGSCHRSAWKHFQ